MDIEGLHKAAAADTAGFVVAHPNHVDLDLFAPSKRAEVSTHNNKNNAEQGAAMHLLTRCVL